MSSENSDIMASMIIIIDHRPSFIKSILFSLSFFPLLIMALMMDASWVSTIRISMTVPKPATNSNSPLFVLRSSLLLHGYTLYAFDVEITYLVTNLIRILNIIQGEISFHILLRQDGDLFLDGIYCWGGI